MFFKADRVIGACGVESSLILTFPCARFKPSKTQVNMQNKTGLTLLGSTRVDSLCRVALPTGNLGNVVFDVFAALMEALELRAGQLGCEHVLYAV